MLVILYFYGHSALKDAFFSKGCAVLGLHIEDRRIFVVIIIFICPCDEFFRFFAQECVCYFLNVCVCSVFDFLGNGDVDCFIVAYGVKSVACFCVCGVELLDEIGCKLFPAFHVQFFCCRCA